MTVQGTAIEAGALAFLTAVVATGAARWVAIRRGLVDLPRADRIHASATPYLGGVAIAGGTLAAFGAFARLGDPQVLVLVLAAAAISCVGLADDLRPLSPAIRLIAECIAATALVAAGVHVDVFARLPVLGHPIDDAGTVAWIVVITNSFNLLDNTDGAAAAIALVTSPILAVLASRRASRLSPSCCSAISAGCAGFLVHNWQPAQIFMGDAGSLFLGFVISSARRTDLRHDRRRRRRAGHRRLGRAAPDVRGDGGYRHRPALQAPAGRRWTEGGRDHIAHRLRAAGLSTSLTALVLTLAAAITGALGLLVISGSIPARGVLAATLAAGGTLVVVAQKVHVYGRPSRRSAPVSVVRFCRIGPGSIPRVYYVEYLYSYYLTVRATSGRQSLARRVQTKRQVHVRNARHARANRLRGTRGRGVPGGFRSGPPGQAEAAGPPHRPGLPDLGADRGRRSAARRSAGRQPSGEQRPSHPERFRRAGRRQSAGDARGD